MDVRSAVVIKTSLNNSGFKKKACFFLELSGGPVVKNPPANAGDMGSIPGLGRVHMWRDLACAPQLLKPLGPRDHAPEEEKPPPEKLSHPN